MNGITRTTGRTNSTPAVLARGIANPFAVTAPVSERDCGARSAGANKKASKKDQPSPDNAAPSRAATPQQLAVNPVTGLVSASTANYQPLTGDQRLKLYVKQNFASIGAYFGPFFTALLLDQADGSPYQWGGGFRGYGRRVASRVGSAIIQGTVQAPTAALLHEDVRYIVSNNGGFKRRAWHAIVYSFVTYNGQGHPTPNIASLSSYYVATAVSTTWLPGRNSLLRYTLYDGTQQVGLSIPINLLQEFWPEISRTIFHRH